MQTGDPTEALFDLRDRADQLQQQADHARASASQAVGVDASGTVEVTLDAEGHAAGVELASNWRGRLSSADLPAAVLAAVQAAGLARLQAWGESMAEQADGPPPPPRPAPAAHESLAARLGDAVDRPDATAQGAPSGAEQVRATLEGLLGLVDELKRGIDEALATAATQAAVTVEGRSGSGRVTATASAAGVLSIAYDDEWLATAGRSAVGRETAEAVRAAQGAAAAAVRDGLAATSLGRLQALADDPAELARRLRLRGD
ncbi:MAG: hypothetical protein ACFCVG_09170 [Kineosporiaceae bacterium]